MGTHSTHKMRSSDSSYYDEICDNCMEPDWNTHTNPKLAQSCVTVRTLRDKIAAVCFAHMDGPATDEMDQKCADAVMAILPTPMLENHRDDYLAALEGAQERIEKLQESVVTLATELSQTTVKLQRATRALEFIACEPNVEGRHAKRALEDIQNIQENGDG